MVAGDLVGGERGVGLLVAEEAEGADEVGNGGREVAGVDVVVDGRGAELAKLGGVVERVCGEHDGGAEVAADVQQRQLDGAPSAVDLLQLVAQALLGARPRGGGAGRGGGRGGGGGEETPRRGRWPAWTRGWGL